MIQARKIWDIERTPETDRKYQEVLEKRGTRGPFGEMHTDLIRFKGYWYCAFKEELHLRSRIIRSVDGKKWETVKLFTWDGAQIYEPKLGITAEGLLMANANIQWHELGEFQLKTACARTPKSDAEPTLTRQHATWLSSNGLDWGSACACPSGINTIRYDFTWHNGMGYSLAYYAHDSSGTLYRTRDGKNWRVLASNIFPEAHRGGYEEASLAFNPRDGSACALVRANPVCAIIGTARSPYYQDWHWREARVKCEDGIIRPAKEVLGVQLGGPKIKYLQDGRLLAVGKADASTATENLGRNDLFWLDPREALLTRFAKLDGFMHYAGIVEHEGMIWVSCGKREPFEVYIIKVKTPS
jgi:hypothetical protein